MGKRLIILGAVLAVGGIIAFLLIPSYRYLGEEFYIKRAKTEAHKHLIRFAHGNGISVKDFEGPQIVRDCCTDDYGCHVLYCHPSCGFKYQSSENKVQTWPLGKGQVCSFGGTATQYSPYLGR